ncbi:cupin domain-containing protein [Crocinitomix catalasitica]|uniref:cupin domain-containing protein n=1 Tax=Crocinitomix catalasitica TaxID=184607 RepID=UPI000487B59F|nr:cupin domain-containing protein [Crocinitomix catalasitica]
MKIASFNDELEYNETRVVTKVIVESSFSKEIRILFKQGQIMKEHKTAYPIIVHVLEGEIEFGVKGETLHLTAGSVISLEGNIPHDLTAHADSIVRLTLSKLDKVERVEKVINND